MDDNSQGPGQDPTRSGYPAREEGASDSQTRRMDGPPPLPPQPPAYQPPPAPTQYLPPQAPGYGQQPYPPAAQQPYQVQPTYNPTPGPALSGYAANPPVTDPTLALVIEIAGGLLGFMGIGHMLTGRLVPGIALLVGWWVAIGLSWIVILPLVLLTCGLGACLLPFLWAGPPILSGLWLRSQMTGRPMFSR
jgi:hypothetical protein